MQLKPEEMFEIQEQMNFNSEKFRIIRIEAIIDWLKDINQRDSYLSMDMLSYVGSLIEKENNYIFSFIKACNDNKHEIDLGLSYYNYSIKFPGKAFITHYEDKVTLLKEELKKIKERTLNKMMDTWVAQDARVVHNLFGQTEFTTLDDEVKRHEAEFPEDAKRN